MLVTKFPPSHIVKGYKRVTTEYSVSVYTLIAVSRNMWYSSFDRVWLGATTIESPEEI